MENSTDSLGADAVTVKYEDITEDFQSPEFVDAGMDIEPTYAVYIVTESNDSESASTVSGQSSDNLQTQEELFKLEVTKSDYTAVQKTQLNGHTNVHEGEEQPFKCGICDYASSKRVNLTVHMRKHTREKPFKCTLCDYVCDYTGSLKVHMKVHTGEKPFKCMLCGYASIQRRQLMQHIRRHTGAKPFNCSICDYGCTHQSQLTVHMRTHTGEKPFKCKYCDYAFVQHSDLKLHQRTHTMY